MPDEKHPPSTAPSATRYAGMGIEFAGAVGGFCLLGWWIDRHWQIANHWGIMICALLGLVGGMYNLVREAFIAARESESHKARDGGATMTDEDRTPGSKD